MCDMDEVTVCLLLPSVQMNSFKLIFRSLSYPGLSYKLHDPKWLSLLEFTWVESNIVISALPLDQKDNNDGTKQHGFTRYTAINCLISNNDQI